MSAIQQEVYEAFRSLDVSEEKAMKAAAALGQREDTLKTEIHAIKTDVAVLKWMGGVHSVMLLAILFKLFLH